MASRSRTGPPPGVRIGKTMDLIAGGEIKAANTIAVLLVLERVRESAKYDDWARRIRG
jgi:hypothetical protein